MVRFSRGGPGPRCGLIHINRVQPGADSKPVQLPNGPMNSGLQLALRPFSFALPNVPKGMSGRVRVTPCAVAW
jgi:hypothetical protein